MPWTETSQLRCQCGEVGLLGFGARKPGRLRSGFVAFMGGAITQRGEGMTLLPLVGGCGKSVVRLASY